MGYVTEAMKTYHIPFKPTSMKLNACFNNYKLENFCKFYTV